MEEGRGVQDRRDRRRWRRGGGCRIGGTGEDGGGGGQEARPYSECEAAQREAGGELHSGVSCVLSAFPQTFMNVICRESVAGVAILEVLVISGCRIELLLNTHTH